MAFSNAETVKAWRESVIAKERLGSPKLIENRHTNTPEHNNHSNYAGKDEHTNYVTPRVHTNHGRDADSYSQSEHTNIYAKREHTNKYTQREHINKYVQSEHTNRYTAPYDKYTRHNNSYHNIHANSNSHYNHINKTRGGNHYNRYRVTRHRDRTDQDFYDKMPSRYDRTSGSYSERAKIDSHTDEARRNRYTESARRDSYSERAARNRYTQSTHTNRSSGGNYVQNYQNYSRSEYSYTAAVDKGFDHINYVPTSPEAYQIEGKVISRELNLNLASYDKNKDGKGTQSAESKDIYYSVEIRQIYDDKGKAVSSSWKTILSGREKLSASIDVKGYKNGVYELRTSAYNIIHGSKQGSGAKNFTFTIKNSSLDCDLTIVNAAEFMNYSYGLDTYSTDGASGGTIKDYTDRIYKNASTSQLKGLFLEVGVDDGIEDNYHKVTAGLRKGGTVIASGYEVVFPKGTDGRQKKGDKKGYVFIPLLDMLDNGSFADVEIVLHVREYEDAALTRLISETTNIRGVSSSKNVIFINLDNKKPTASITAPSSKKRTHQKIDIRVDDVGLGLREAKYQIVKKGGAPKDADWKNINTETKVKSFYLTEAGNWDIYVKAIDKAGNEINASKKGYRIGTATVTVDIKKTVEKGTDVSTEGRLTADNDMLPEKTEFTIEKIGSKDGNLKEKTQSVDKTTYIYENFFHIPDDIPAGDYIIHFKVTFDDDSEEEATKSFRVVDELKADIIRFGVEHTPKWEENRKNNNSDIARKYRAPEFFWSGEKFIVGADIRFKDKASISEEVMLESVRITNQTKKDGTEYSYSFKQYISKKKYESNLERKSDGSYLLKQRGAIWDGDMMYRWGRSKPQELKFEFTFKDGTVCESTVFVCSEEEYFRYHGIHR